MAASFSVTVDDAELRRELARLIQRVSDPTEAMQGIGRTLGNRTEDAFQAEASPFGVRWARLTPDYVRRARGGDAHPILQRDGGLAASITQGGDARSAWVGASKRYAAIHQFGGTSGMAPGPAAIPPRPYLPVDNAGVLAPGASEEILKILVDYLAG